MKNFLVLVVFTCIGFLFPNQVLGHSKNCSQIYPTADQVLITPKNIFVYSINNENLIKVERVECIEGRICATVLDDINKIEMVYGVACPVHPIYHQQCKGCGVLLCPFNCKCYD